MVAVIKSSRSIKNVLHYNENKLAQKAAGLIYAHGFAKDTEKLGFTDKLRTFEKLISLNESTKLSTVHISLNFDPSEKLDSETLSKIAESYMQKIGFGGQPYLVYEHHDAGHPHIHIVSTNIQRDGRRIKMQNIGRNQSEKAREELEKEFHLVPAQRAQKITHELKPVAIGKVLYGKTETRRAITNVLDKILPLYKYSSLPELNAILRQYNIIADRGSKESRTYKSGGLFYRVLDERGQKIGTPIKASAIYNKPTLKFLQEKFSQNEVEKQRFKQRLRNTIDLAFVKQPQQSLQGLMATLSKEKLQVVLRQNEQGVIYGVTYVDHASKCVFNGSDLGKSYSANGIQERCKADASLSLKASIKPAMVQKETPTINQKDSNAPDTKKGNELLDHLTRTEYGEQIAFELKKQQFKKRKRKRLYH